MRKILSALVAAAWTLAAAPASAEPCSNPAWKPAASLESLGWSPSGLLRLRAELEQLGSAAFLIIDDGQVVFQHGDIARNYETHSIRKTLLSALVGIAIADGKIRRTATLKDMGIDDTVALDEVERSATIMDLIAARSGVYIPAAAETPQARARRPARHSHKPGTHWYYNNWDFNVAGEVYQRATGRSVFTAFDALIAKPLCMQDFDPYSSHYDYEPEFSRFPAYYFRISTRDLARFGQLYLDKGRWGDKQIVPASWVEESTRAHSATGDTGSSSGYGYMWWVAAPSGPKASALLPPGSYTASGWHGHRMTVIPGERTLILNRMNTDDDKAPFFEDRATWDRILGLALSARKP